MSVCEPSTLGTSSWPSVFASSCQGRNFCGSIPPTCHLARALWRYEWLKQHLLLGRENRVIKLGLHAVLSGPVTWVVTGIDDHLITWPYEPRRTSTPSSWSKYIHITLLVKLEKLRGFALIHPERQISVINTVAQAGLQIKWQFPNC